MQEGTQDSVLITILLQNNQATINSIGEGNKELGLNTTLAQVDCKN